MSTRWNNLYTYVCMKVFFTCSYSGKSKYQDSYDLVVKAIQEFPEIDIISPELGDYTQVLDRREITQLHDRERVHYAAIKKGIELADVVIIDITEEGFQLGHEATLAIMGKKPVLVLSRFKNYAKLITNPYLYGAKYDKFTIEATVNEFLMKHLNPKLSQRFNLFLSRRQMELLEQKAKSAGLTKSELIRRHIEGGS
jgi:hypothetical protein